MARSSDCGNAAHIKAVPGRKRTEGLDPWLADLCASGCKESFVPDEEQHELRAIGGPASSWCARTDTAVQRIQKTLTEANIKLGIRDQRHGPHEMGRG